MSFEHSCMSSVCLQIKILRMEFSANYFKKYFRSMISCMNVQTIRAGKRRQREVRNTKREKYKQRIKYAFFPCQRKTLGFVLLWQCVYGKEGRDMTVEK